MTVVDIEMYYNLLVHIAVLCDACLLLDGVQTCRDH
jgi:hypothetical protein